MNIGLLCRNPKLYSHQRLMEAARDRGHTIRAINPLRCYMNITARKPTVFYKDGEELAEFDAIIPRIGASITFYGTAVLRQFEVMGVWPLNESVAIARARDKLRAHQLMSRSPKVDMPRTAFLCDVEDTRSIIKLVGGAPLVIKLLEGTQGVGVVLAETGKAAESVVSAFHGAEVNILVQEFIAEAGGADIRAFVVGGKVVAAMQRKAAEGEFRANLHRGGTAELVKLTKEERAMAVAAAATLGLNVAGVDLIRSERGPLVLEVNSSPGLEGIEAASGKDIAGAIIDFTEANARPNRTKTRGKG